jgi:hypothetical protein
MVVILITFEKEIAMERWTDEDQNLMLQLTAKFSRCAPREIGEEDMTMVAGAFEAYTSMEAEDQARFDEEIHKFWSNDDVVAAVDNSSKDCGHVPECTFSVGGNDFVFKLTSMTFDGMRHANDIVVAVWLKVQKERSDLTRRRR